MQARRDIALQASKWYVCSLGKGPIVEGYVLEVDNCTVTFKSLSCALSDMQEYTQVLDKIPIVETSGSVLKLSKEGKSAILKLAGKSAILVQPDGTTIEFTSVPPNYKEFRLKWEELSGEPIEQFMKEK